MNKETLDKLLNTLVSLQEEESTESWERRVIGRAIFNLETITNSYYWKEQGYDIAPEQAKGQTYYHVECPGLYRVAYLNYWTTQRISNSTKQPKPNSWIFRLSFDTGAYIFGDDYDVKLFDEFFNELKQFNYDFIDDLNHSLYWYIENARGIAKTVSEIYKKYCEIHEKRLKKRKIAEMEKELAKMKEELI